MPLDFSSTANEIRAVADLLRGEAVVPQHLADDLSSLGSSDTAANLEKHVQSFSPDARQNFEHFKFPDFVHLLDDANLLSPLCSKVLLKHLGEHDDDAEICKDAKGNIEPNPDLRDNENAPLGEDIHTYFAREVTPHVPLAWIDESKRDDKDGGIGSIGYEIPFNRHFYTYNPPRQLDAIDSELAEVTGEIQDLLQEVAGQPLHSPPLGCAVFLVFMGIGTCWSFAGCEG